MFDAEKRFQPGRFLLACSAAATMGSEPMQAGGGRGQKVGGEMLKDSPEEVLRAYVRSFETLDPETILPFYHLPCMFLSPLGVLVASTLEETKGLVVRLIEQARSQGYKRTEITDLEIFPYAENLVSLLGVFVRFDADDREIARFGFAYTWLHNGAAWRIVTAVAHPAAEP